MMISGILENPQRKIKEIPAAVIDLSQKPGVDDNRNTGLGICTSSEQFTESARKVAGERATRHRAGAFRRGI